MKIRSDWNWLVGATVICTLLIPTVLFVSSCGGGTAPASAAITETSPSAPAVCTGTGLAAKDLAGQCRATPQATMGALEAAIS